MKILVCGGRNYHDRDALFQTLDKLHGKVGVTTVVHGAARGADTLAGQWAAARGVRCDEYPADWSRHGRRAGYIRNRLMLDDSDPDAVVAFPGGPGTADMVRISRRAGYKVLCVKPGG